VPLAAAATCSFTRDRSFRRLGAPPALAACAVALLAWAVIGSLVGTAGIQNERLNQLQYIAKVGVGSYARLSVQMLLVLTLMLLPIGLASLRGRRRLPLTAAFAATLAGWPLLSSSSAWNPLAPAHATLSVYELGSARNLIAGDSSLPAHLGWLPAVARVLAFLSLGAMLAAIGGVRRVLTQQPAARFCALIVLLHLGLVSALWLYADRYYLALLPALVACVLLAWREAPLSPVIAAVAIAAQLAIGITGTRDALQYSEICRSTYAVLRQAGIRPYDIDAGWSWNGWILYAQQNLPEGVDRERDIPSVTSKAPRPFMFAKTPVEGYEPLLHIQWKGSAWPWPNELYVLTQDGAPVRAQY
jgi:hypothetical protein